MKNGSIQLCFISARSTRFPVILGFLKIDCRDLGPSYDDLEPLRNKALEKMVGEAEGVPSAKYALLDFKNMFNINTEIDRIKRLIGTFPMLRKPVHGAGCGGCARVNDEKELLEWIRETVDEEYDGVCDFLSIRS